MFLTACKWGGPLSWSKLAEESWQNFPKNDSGQRVSSEVEMVDFTPLNIELKDINRCLFDWGIHASIYNYIIVYI